MSAIRNAIVLVGPGDEGRTVAGLPHLVRTVLTLQRAEIERVVLIGATAAPTDTRISCEVEVRDEFIPTGDDPWLVMGPGAVVDVVLARRLQSLADTAPVLQFEKRGARVRVASGGAAVVFDATGSTPPVGTLLPLSDDDARIETTLLRALENHRDGYFDRMLHRRLSRPLSRRLLRAGVSPNTVTVVGVAIGVAGGIMVGGAGVGVVGVAIAMLMASSVLDCSDGELARLGFAESKLGHLLDVTGDTVVHLSLLAGIARRLAADGAMPETSVLVLLGIGVLGSFAAITWSEVNEDRRHQVPCWENDVLDGVLSPLTTRDWYLFPLLFAVAGRLDLLVQAAAVGAQGFWVTVALLVRRVLARTGDEAA